MLAAGDKKCGAALTWSLVDEGARLDPRSSYAASKLAQEHYERLASVFLFAVTSRHS